MTNSGIDKISPILSRLLYAIDTDEVLAISSLAEQVLTKEEKEEIVHEVIKIFVFEGITSSQKTYCRAFLDFMI